jgi:hypothetical protein
MYREVNRAMEVEPDGGDKMLPPQLVDSPFGIKEMNQIEALLDEVVVLDGF